MATDPGWLSNHLGYGLANPTGKVDPTGLIPIDGECHLDDHNCHERQAAGSANADGASCWMFQGNWVCERYGSGPGIGSGGDETVIRLKRALRPSDFQARLVGEYVVLAIQGFQFVGRPGSNSNIIEMDAKDPKNFAEDIS